MLILGLLITGLVFIAYRFNRYEGEHEFKNWERREKLTYTSPLVIGELEQQIKSKFAPSFWNQVRLLKIADNQFVLYGVFLKAAIQVHPNHSGSIVELKTGQHGRIKTGSIIFLLACTVIFAFIFASDNVKSEGEAVTTLDKIGGLAFVLFALGIVAFLFHIGKDDFQKEIVRKLKLSRKSPQ